MSHIEILVIETHRNKTFEVAIDVKEIYYFAQILEVSLEVNKFYIKNYTGGNDYNLKIYSKYVKTVSV